MALNSDSANSRPDLEDYSKNLDKILDMIAQTPGSVQEVLSLGRSLLKKQDVQIRPLLTEMVNNVDRPLLKQMAQDVVTVMSNWFEDPQTLCCLIQGIFALAGTTRDGWKLSETDFGKWLDIIIAFVDIVIVILSSGLKKLAIMIPDFIKEIMNGVIGAILLVLQEILFTIRDSLINELLEAFDSTAKTDQIWAKCLPLMELIEILRKYISDYGLFAELFEKIKGYIGNIVGDFGYLKAFDFPKNIKDIEFLYWFRELLLKLKQAALSFDLCFLPQSEAPGGVLAQVPNSVSTLAQTDSIKDIGGLSKGNVNPDEIQGITIAPDRTILDDKDRLKKNSVPLLTNSSTRGFLHKYYGYPYAVIDTLIVGATSKDSVQGTDTGGNLDLNADCPNSPTPSEIVKWALRIRNRNK